MSGSRFLPRLAVLLAPVVAACGGAAAAGNVTASDAAHTAVQANEPRTADPTATQTAPTPPPSVSTSVPLTSGPTSTSAAPASPAPAATAEETTPPKKISARHVLVQWMGTDRAGKSVLRSREQALALIEEVQRRAKAGEDLGRLANEYSDEPNAGARGGSLGRFGRGQMVGAFEIAAFKLKVGEISDIVETPFGFHIIQRTE